MPQKFEREQVIVSSFHFYLRGDVTIVVMLGECQASHFYSSSLSYRQKDGIGGAPSLHHVFISHYLPALGGADTKTGLLYHGNPYSSLL